MYVKCLIVLIISNISFILNGQSVGLVFSGGGSKGLAHIGVLMALEEHRIPIDYIGGTSMGAIVGSLYAMGYDPDEMVEIVKSDNFNNWLTGNIDKEYRYYFKSERPDPDIFSLGFDLSDTIPKISLPLSIVPNHLMDFAFMEIYAAASAAAQYDFNQLFVPFLCIGSDISNNKEVIFRKGNLSQAVRASMTFPVYFRPILIEGNIMYDGGIYNNFPMNRVKEEFNPDYIIGSKTAQGNKPPDEYDIMAQIENMVMQPVDFSINKDDGILLDMKFQNPSLMGFERIDEYVELGYKSTLEKIDSIKMHVHRTGYDSLELKEMRENFRSKFPELLFHEIIIEGLDEDQKQYVEKSIRRNADTFDINFLRKEYLKLANDKNLRYIYPKAEYNASDSLYSLRLRIVPQSPLEAKIGLFFATSGQTQTFLGLSYRNLSEITTHFKGNIQFGRFYDGGSIGVRFDYPSKIPAYFESTLNFNRFNYNQTHTDFFFEDLRPPFMIQNQVNFRIDMGTPFSVNGIFMGGVSVGRNSDIYYQSKNFESTDTSDVSTINQLSIYLSAKSSTLNEKQLATSGSYRKFAVRGGYDSEMYEPGSTSGLEFNQYKNYFWLGIKYEDLTYFDLSNRIVLGASIVAEARFKPLLSNYYSTIIEAPVFNPNIITSSLLLEQYRANQYFAVGLMPIFKISKKMNLKLEAYAFVPAQEILKDENNQAVLGNYFQTVKPIFNGSFNLATPVGPISFNTSYLHYEEKKWIIQLSFGYLMFNRRTLEE